ncbi:MAG: ABC transporter permease, partial [Vicinamibacterales bacterium]
YALREEARDARGLRVLEELCRDVRIGVRPLRRRPGFAVSVILTLAVGIGANVAVFSVVHAVLLRPFAYPAYDPDRVLLMAERSRQGVRRSVSYPTFRDWVEQLESFESLSGVLWMSSFTLTRPDGPVRSLGGITSSTYFGIHGIQPLHGRLYDVTDDRVGAARVVVLTHPYWQNVFGARSDVVGETLQLGIFGNTGEYTVVGVLPPGVGLTPEVDMTPGVDFYTPLEPWVQGNFGGVPSRGQHFGMEVQGRLRASVSFEQAKAELTATAARFETEYPDTNAGVEVIVDRLSEWQLRSYRSLLWALQAAVLILWLLATTNVANLMLARAVTRRRQYAVSAALGAGSLRTLRPVLIENLMLSLIAGAGGLVIALGVVQLVRTMTPFDVPRLADATLNGPVAALGLGLAVLAGLVAGLLPGLWVARRVDVTAVLNEDGAQARAGGGGRRLHRGLLVIEVALSTLLLVGAGALIRTVVDLTRVDPGFHNDRILTAQLSLIDAGLDAQGTVAVYRDLRQRLDALPEVVSSGLVQSLPLLGSLLTGEFMVADQPAPTTVDQPRTAVSAADAGYFETIGIPLLSGRHISDTDTRDSLPVVVVTETLARRFWPTESALGKRLRFTWFEAQPWREIVGVVGDLRQDGLDSQSRFETFVPIEQLFPYSVAIVAQTTGEPLGAVGPVRAAIRAAHPDLLVTNIRSMDDVVATQMAPRRFIMWTLGLFGLVAILIAAVGIYGILAHAVAQRAHELGIRMALGADRGDLRALVMREGVVTAMAGVVVGVAGSLAALRLLESLLLPETTNDPWLWVLVPVFVLTVALVASFVPARRAARTDPIVALRGV